MSPTSQPPLSVKVDSRMLCIKRASIIPFETATAVLAIWTGIASFFEYGVGNIAFQAALPEKLVVAFNLVYVLSGAFMLAGICWDYRNVEATGVILLLASLVVRLIAVTGRVGITPVTITVLIQGVAFGIACIARLLGLLRSEIIVREKDLPAIVAAAEITESEK